MNAAAAKPLVPAQYLTRRQTTPTRHAWSDAAVTVAKSGNAAADDVLHADEMVDAVLDGLFVIRRCCGLHGVDEAARLLFAGQVSAELADRILLHAVCVEQVQRDGNVL